MTEFVLPVSLRVRARQADVFAAWTDPAVAARWQCARLDGTWAVGTTVVWNFGEHRQELRVLAVEAPSRVEFAYRAYGTQAEARVRLEFKDLGEETGLKLEESSWPLTAEGAAILADHACGWENMFCRLKVYLELGAGFDFARGCFEGPR